MTEKILANLVDFDFEQYIGKVVGAEEPLLFIFSCGYESRALAQYKLIKERLSSNKIIPICFGFSTFKNFGSRLSNDKVLSDDGIIQVELDPKEGSGPWEYLRSNCSEELKNNTYIYIDYSSMPRTWYCDLAVKMVQGNLGKNAALVYSHGRYFESTYPCVGYGNFERFSGRPNITSTSEINIFGLGFDSTRTYGIWSHLDPQISVAIIAKSPQNIDHCIRVRRDNPEIISAAESVQEVCIDEFSSTLSQLIDIGRQYSRYGDVSLVPDGPKPLVLAMSLVPYYLNIKGVYCWYVGDVKPDDYQPVDVEWSGELFGFQYS